MSEAHEIKFTEEAQAVLQEMQTMPARMLQEIATALDQENQYTVSHIQAQRMTGVGPFPVEQHKLGVRTNRLRSSVRASSAEIDGQRVVSGIGSNVLYARVHELGARIHHPARSGSVRLRTDARGGLLRQRGSQHLAVFAAGHHKRAKEVKYEGKAYDVEMPARAPITTGVEDRAANYDQAVSAAVVRAWEDKK